LNSIGGTGEIAPKTITNRGAKEYLKLIGPGTSITIPVRFRFF